MAKRSLFSTPFSTPGSPLAWVVLLPLFAILAWYFLPVTRGDFVADDYVFIATSRMVDAPFAAFWQSHFYEPYYFRPIGVLSWWAATWLIGLDYVSHSLINLFLHTANAGLLFWLLRALALRTSAVFAGVALFALGPFALATILWPSNRFDLLACAFLLMQAIAVVRALQGRALAVPLAMAAALAACWSKELAYPVATTMALVVLAATRVPWRRRALLFVALGVAIGGAFLARHLVVPEAYALASGNPIERVINGASAMMSALPRLSALVVGGEWVPWLGWGLLAALFFGGIWERRDVEPALHGVPGATLLVLLAAVVVQTPLAAAFAPMLDGGPFGTATFARFYYAPWVAVSAFGALVLSRGRLGGVVAVAVTALMIVAAMASRPLSESFAAWTRAEVKPMAAAATKVVDENPGAACVYVFLGTQSKHPFFRMFSDVTVKARTATPEKTWRCHVMTESTPWLFAFPAAITPMSLPLVQITNPNGTNKADATWSSIRYRYRLPAKDLAALPEARFFDWRDGVFIDVTNDVRSGERKVQSVNW